MKRTASSAIFLLCCIAQAAGDNQTPKPRKTAPLPIVLPIPAYISTPPDFIIAAHMEPLPIAPRPPLMVVEGVQNLALGKPVTSSDKQPIAGELKLVTDGNKDSTDDSYVELHRKTQWVQIDLEAPVEIHAVAVWHAHNAPMFYHAVVIQIADDAEFTRNVRTLFNNDYQNVNWLGVGQDKEYFESYEGKLIAVKGETARYLRAYSRGSTFNVLNRYIEIEVYGLSFPFPAGTGRGTLGG